MNREQLFSSLKSRNQRLESDIVNLKEDLFVVFSNNTDAGIVDRGYYTEFNRVLEKYRSFGIISKWMLSEDEYVIDGNLVKIPVVDVTVKTGNQRLFVIGD